MNVASCRVLRHLDLWPPTVELALSPTPWHGVGLAAHAAFAKNVSLCFSGLGLNFVSIEDIPCAVWQSELWPLADSMGPSR